MRLNRVSPIVALAAIVACGLLSPSCRRGGPSRNLTAGKQPIRSADVASPALLTDDRSAADGAEWNAAAATAFQGDRAFVEYDLGQVEPIDAAYIQADNNDEYVFTVSDDGQAFRPLWVAPPVPSPGLRGRSTEGLGARGRYVRMSPRGGDGAYSVAELQLWTGAPPQSAGPTSSELLAARVRADFIYLVLAFAVVLFVTRAGQARGRVAAAWLLPVAAALALLGAMAAAWPLGAREISAARASAAAIVLLALFRGWEGLRRAAPHRPSIVAACATGAVLAFACFYNLGRPQFWNQGKQRPMFVHVTDMRIYQPFAKYFDELRYDGIYLASALAFAEDERGGSPESIGATKIRDLRDFRLRTASELKDDMFAVKRRFSPARWADFKRDLVFFREAMGAGFITSLDDHGANAPPSWVWLARLAIGHVPANETTLTIAGLLDAVLLLAMAWAIARSFGLVPMLVAMTVFGATDVYMFGTNWGGATFRHDWLVLLGFAACALRKERWRLAGVLLGAGTILRVIPAVGLLGVVAPAVAWLVGQWLQRHRPSLRTLLTTHRAAVRVIVAAALTMFVFILMTGFLYSFDAWREWGVRIHALNNDFANNEIDLRMLIAGADQTAAELLRARSPLFMLILAASVVVVVLAARKRPLEDAMLLGLPLALVLMNPVNYHVHFVFLLVLLGARGGLLSVAAPLLALCVAGYWIDLDPDYNRHFEVLTAAFFATLAVTYINVLTTPAPASHSASTSQPAS